MIITLDYFNLHSGNNDTARAEIKTDCIDYAQEEIEKFLGYPVDSAQYSYDGGTYSDYQLALPHWIASIESVIVDGTPLEAGDYRKTKNFIIFSSRVRDSKIEVEYHGGFSAMPASIKLAAAEIATIRLSNTLGEISMSAKQMPDGIGWTRVNHGNYASILKAIAKYKI